jgi:hypothetical protein
MTNIFFVAKKLFKLHFNFVFLIGFHALSQHNGTEASQNPQAGGVQCIDYSSLKYATEGKQQGMKKIDQKYQSAYQIMVAAAVR